MTQDNRDRRDGTMERHLQSIGIAITTGSIAFAGAYFFTDSSEKAIITTQLTHLNTPVAEMRTEVRTMQTIYATKEVVVDVEKRLREIEKKVR